MHAVGKIGRWGQAPLAAGVDGGAAQEHAVVVDLDGGVDRGGAFDGRAFVVAEAAGGDGALERADVVAHGADGRGGDGAGVCINRVKMGLI